MRLVLLLLFMSTNTMANVSGQTFMPVMTAITLSPSYTTKHITSSGAEKKQLYTDRFKLLKTAISKVELGDKNQDNIDVIEFNFSIAQTFLDGDDSTMNNYINTFGHERFDNISKKMKAKFPELSVDLGLADEIAILKYYINLESNYSND